MRSAVRSVSNKQSLNRIDKFQPANFWLGPRAADLIRLGAKFSPCMRADLGIIENIERRKLEEANNSGCW